MTINRLYIVRCAMLALLFVSMVHNQDAHAQKKNTYACKEPDPTALCTAANTCGSASRTMLCRCQAYVECSFGDAEHSGSQGKLHLLRKGGHKRYLEERYQASGFCCRYGANLAL